MQAYAYAWLYAYSNVYAAVDVAENGYAHVYVFVHAYA